MHAPGSKPLILLLLQENTSTRSWRLFSCCMGRISLRTQTLRRCKFHPSRDLSKHQSAATLKPLTGQLRNTIPLLTLQCSAGKKPASRHSCACYFDAWNLPRHFWKPVISFAWQQHCSPVAEWPSRTFTGPAKNRKKQPSSKLWSDLFWWDLLEARI